MNTFWFAIWEEAKKQLLTENEGNFRKHSFRSKEQYELTASTSEAVVKSGH